MVANHAFCSPGGGLQDGTEYLCPPDGRSEVNIDGGDPPEEEIMDEIIDDIIGATNSAKSKKLSSQQGTLVKRQFPTNTQFQTISTTSTQTITSITPFSTYTETQTLTTTVATMTFSQTVVATGWPNAAMKGNDDSAIIAGFACWVTLVYFVTMLWTMLRFRA